MGTCQSGTSTEGPATAANKCDPRTRPVARGGGPLCSGKDELLNMWNGVGGGASSNHQDALHKTKAPTNSRLLILFGQDNEKHAEGERDRSAAGKRAFQDLHCCFEPASYTLF